MSADFFEFRWRVAKDGYAWKEGRSADQPRPPDPLPRTATDDQKLLHRVRERESRVKRFLVDPVPLHSNLAGWRWTQPLSDYPFDLHQRFARVEPTPDGIMEFARRHGRLGGDLTEPLPLADPETGEMILYGAEREDAWLDELRALKGAVEVWKSIRDNSTAELNDRVKRHGPGGRPLKPFVLVDMTSNSLRESNPYHRRLFTVPSGNPTPEIFRQVEPRDHFNRNPPLLALKRVIDERLAKKNRVVVSPLWNTDTEKLELHGVPTSLIGAIWLDFALAVVGEVQYRRCARVDCQLPFAVRPKARNKKLFCSGKCRVAVSRNPELRDPAAAI